MPPRPRPHARSGAALALALLLTGGGAGLGHAQVFKPNRPFPISMPTAAQCADHAFMMRATMAAHDHCQRTLSEALVAQVRSARMEHRLQTERVSGLTPEGGRAATVVQATRIVPAGMIPMGVVPMVNRPDLVYAQNGTRVESCAEYLYERFYTVSRFRDEARRLRTGRAIFDLAFAPDGMWNLGHRMATATPGATGIARHLSGHGTRADQPYDPIPLLPADRPLDLGVFVVDLPKNDYFALSDAELALVGNASRPLRDRLANGRRWHRVRLGGPLSSQFAGQHPTPWQWHRDQSAALAHHDDARLRLHADRRAAFRGILADLRAARAAGLGLASPRYQASLTAMLSALNRADRDGCLDTSGPTACDWAPEDLLPQVEAAMANRLTAAEQACAQNAPPPASVANGYTFRVGARDLRTGVDPYRSAYDLQTYLDRRAAGRRYAIAALQAAPGDPDLRVRHAGGDQWGDPDWAAAGYDHRLAFGLADRAITGPDGGLCALNPHLDAGFSAWAALLGDRQDLISAAVGFDARRRSKALDLSVLGVSVYHPASANAAGGPRQTLAFNYAPTPQFSREVSDGFEGCVALPVAGVPFQLCAGLVATLGVETHFAIDAHEEAPNGDCQPQGAIEARARPYASVSAFGTAGPSVLGLGGGLYAELEVLEAALPVEAEASLVFDRNLDDTEVAVSTEAHLSLASLAGEVGGFVDFPRFCLFGECIGGRYSHTFFRWPRAVEATIALFEARWGAAFSVWQAVCADTAVDCKL